MPMAGARRASKSFDAGSGQRVNIDTLGLAHILQTEALTTTSLLILSTCAVGFMLYFLREILIPFAIAIFFMYILQPIVNYLSKPPRRWCHKCCRQRGEQCCEGFFAITRSRQYSEVLDDDALEVREGGSTDQLDSRDGGCGGRGGDGEIVKEKETDGINKSRSSGVISSGGGGDRGTRGSAGIGGGGGDGGVNGGRNDRTISLGSCRLSLSPEALRKEKQREQQHQQLKLEQRQLQPPESQRLHHHHHPHPPTAHVHAYPSRRRRPSCFLDRPLIPRWVAVMLAIAFAFLILLMVALILYGSALKLQEDIPTYERGAQEIGVVLKKWLAVFHYSLDDDLVPWVIYRVHHATPRFLSLVLATITNGLYVLIFLIYLLVSPVRPIPNGVWGQIDLHIRRYIRLKTAVCVGAGTSVGVTLFLLRIPLAWVFGLVTFIFNFMPNIGPLFATMLPMPVAIFNPDISPTVKVATFVLPAIIHLLIGNFVEPRVFGESFDLSPVVVLLSLAFWGSLWGIPGMVLSVPMMVMARIVCLHLQHPYASTVVAVLEGKYFETFERWDEATLATFRDRMSSWDYTFSAINDNAREGAQETLSPSQRPTSTAYGAV